MSDRSRDRGVEPERHLLLVPNWRQIFFSRVIRNVSAGSVQRETRQVSLDDANRVKVNISCGGGDFEIEGSTADLLRGEWQRLARVHIQAGASRVLLRVPRDIGVRVSPGDLRRGDYDGLKQRRDGYVNRLHGQSHITLDISLDLGSGKLDIKQVN